MKNNLRIKVFVLTVVNIVLFTLLYKGFSQRNKFQEIINNQSPISARVINISYHAKSSTTCDIIYNNKKYENVEISRNKIVEGKNNTDFYYDSKEDSIFYKNNGKQAFNVFIILFIISLFLWFLPSNKFKLTK